MLAVGTIPTVWVPPQPMREVRRLLYYRACLASNRRRAINQAKNVHTDGESIRGSNLRRRSFLPLLRRADVPRIRLHDLRHTAATLDLRQGTHSSFVA